MRGPASSRRSGRTAPSRAASSLLLPAALREPCPRTWRRRRRQPSGPRPNVLSPFLLSGRDRSNDANGIELGALRNEGSVTARRRVEDEEANLVLRNMDRAVE